ncbi:AAA family ATPase [Runella sp. MFBS21]|jgi:ATP-dependent exoDNAse (exonuclease V) alpha subunit|uniref:ATP-dependent DNA helicase n=1 Tax=Runella TaxID=105 RepID=UPI00040D245F|nr:MULTISPECIES: AAA family ATPase [Runella]MDF7817643.1 AAA family ATPase [Runella sp. MFBS21]
MKETPPLTSAALVQKAFPHEPTSGQQHFFTKIAEFLENEDVRDCFLLKGYAGTGKTTLISTVIKVITKFGYKTVLLAPTGRAAKVMSNYSKKKALTIHKKIYRQVADAYTGTLHFERQSNKHRDTLFIVDEASMISDEAEFGSHGLLYDLIEYVFEGIGNKLLIVGDVAQLPPINKELSPALDKSYLESTFYLSVYEQELTEVTRQGQHSGILRNATSLRDTLPLEKLDIKLQTKGLRDFYKMPSDRLEDGLRYAYEKHGRENVTIITRSNREAVQLNQFVRRQINAAEEELEVGDLLMIVRNNYTVLDEESPAGFLANGDFVEVKRIRKEEEVHGFRFATVELQLLDYEEQPPFEAKIFLDTLHSPSPSLTQEENRRLYEAVLEDYMYLKTKKARNEAIRQDVYLNALQVKFAYALTCHKSQGGQWKSVFVNQGFLPEDQVNKEFVRWLYTAVTRATDEIFMMNFHAQFFE